MIIGFENSWSEFKFILHGHSKFHMLVKQHWKLLILHLADLLDAIAVKSFN